MNCPRCGSHSEVERSRAMPDGAAVRRRRRCLSPTCRHGWTTHEFETERVAAYVPKRVLKK